MIWENLRIFSLCGHFYSIYQLGCNETFILSNKQAETHHTVRFMCQPAPSVIQNLMHSFFASGSISSPSLSAFLTLQASVLPSDSLPLILFFPAKAMHPTLIPSSNHQQNGISFIHFVFFRGLAQTHAQIHTDPAVTWCEYTAFIRKVPLRAAALC